MRTISRSLSILVVAYTAWQAWPFRSGEWYVVLEVVPVLAFIWYPETIDEMTFGTTRSGNLINAHTPAFLIAAVGWVLLLLGASSVVAPTAWCRLFGAC